MSSEETPRDSSRRPRLARQGHDTRKLLEAAQRLGNGEGHDVQPGASRAEARSLALAELLRVVAEDAAVSRPPDTELTEYCPSPAELDGRLEQLVLECRKELLCVLPLGPSPANGIERERERGEHMVAQGVDVRWLCPPDVLRCPRSRLHILDAAERGVRVRVTNLAPHDMLVFDHQAAVVPTTGDGVSGGLVYYAPAVIYAFWLLFHVKWRQGREPGAITGSRALADDQVRDQVLAALNRGDKDEVAARVVGVSLRTYRRHVAHALQELGASSRFQAGAVAAQRGLV